jgi:hypothetical protein
MLDDGLLVPMPKRSDCEDPLVSFGKAMLKHLGSRRLIGVGRHQVRVIVDLIDTSSMRCSAKLTLLVFSVCFVKRSSSVSGLTIGSGTNHPSTGTTHTDSNAFA